MIILTASGWGQHQNTFNDDVESTINKLNQNKNISKIEVLQWQIPNRISQKLQDLLDFRPSREIVQDVANQLLVYYDYAIKNYEELIIISYSTGSVVIENGLKVLELLASHKPKIIHFMFAPAITGSHLAEFAVNILPWATGLATLAGVSQTEGKLQYAIALLGGALTTLFTFAKDTMLQLLSKFITVEPKLIDCERIILISNEDEILRTIPQAIPNARYCLGSYSHLQIGDLTDEGLKQKYRLDDNIFSKEEIIRSLFD